MAYAHIDFSLSKGAREQLELGLRWHEEGHSGSGLEPRTVAEARRLLKTGMWWPEKVKRAYSFFSRHGAQSGPMRDDKGKPTPKAVAWALWGGDAGFSNVKRIRESMLAADGEGKRSVVSAIMPYGMHYPTLSLSRNLSMKNTPEAQLAYRAAIAHAMEHADLHARMLADGHVGDEHREMHIAHACRALDMADALHGVMCEVLGESLKRDDEGEDFAILGGIENSALAQRFAEVSAKVGKLPRSIRSVVKAELGRIDADLLEEKLMGAKTDRAALLALKQQAAESAKAVDRAETEKAIESALDERLITPADAQRMRGIDPATKQASGQPWGRSRVERFVAERREGGPVAPIARPGAERTVTTQQNQTTSSQVPVRVGSIRGAANPVDIREAAAKLAAAMNLDPDTLLAKAQA